MAITALHPIFHVLQLLLLILLFVFLLLIHRPILTSVDAAAATNPPLTPPSAACSNELVTFSTCLPYVAVSPNNLTDSPPPQCCEDVSAAFGNGSAICLCYVILRPKIFGFPLNSTKLFSLTSVCPKDQSSKANFSLETLCSGSSALPPLQSITGPSNLRPHNSGVNSPPPPLMGSAQETNGSSPTQEPADELPSQPSLSDIPIIVSSARARIYSPSQTLLGFPIYISLLYKSPAGSNSYVN